MNTSRLKKIKVGADRLKTDIFQSYKKEVDLSIKKALKKIENDKKRKLPSLSKNSLEQAESAIRKHAKKSIGTENILIEPSPNYIVSGLTATCYSLPNNADPIDNARKLTESINEETLSFFSKNAQAIKAFVNIPYKQKVFYPMVLKEICKQGESFGSSNINIGKVAIIDYSSPNIAKPIGVGHMRSTNIGQALKNILEKTGYSVIGHNYIGDWGTQFGKLIYAYQNWGDGEKIKENPLSELKNLYVRFHEEAEKNPELEDNAREIFKKLEQKDPELLQLWKEFRDLSIKGIKKTYQRLGIDFDLWFGESYFNELSKEVVKECLNKKIAHKDPETGAIVAEPDNLPTLLLQKQNGSTLYSARDLANLKLRLEKFNPNEILYVVGDDQKLYFHQIFTLINKLDWSKNKQVNIEHIGFGLILKEKEKMSTRKGSLIELDDLLNEAIRHSEKVIRQKKPDLNDKEIKAIAKIIGIGAVIYNDLRQSRERNISFNWDKMLNFEGESSIYLQYTYVRIQSILRKIGTKIKLPQNILFEEPIEFNLAEHLSRFPSIIKRVAETKSPHTIATYLEELAQLFNNFYNEINVIDTKDKDLLGSRIVLINSVALVIKNGLQLLNIQVPDKM